MDLMVERLLAEGCEQAEAEAEARRRFGNPEVIAEECEELRVGSLRMASRVLGLLLLVMTGFLAAENSWLALIGLALPALAGGVCALRAASGAPGSGLMIRMGRWLLGLQMLSVLVIFGFSAQDWVHTFWSIQYPLLGLCFGAGPLLVDVWPEDRRLHGRSRSRWNGATLALVAALTLGSLPVLLALSPIDPHPVGRSAGFCLVSLVEVAQYGFGGEIPSSMQPQPGLETERGLGIPPRDVTVPMALSLFAALAWSVFAALALLSRAFNGEVARTRFLLVAPVLLTLLVITLQLSFGLRRAVWSNKPWFVGAYGPGLLIAGVAVLVLFALLRRARVVRE